MDERFVQLLSDLVRNRGKVLGILVGLILGWMVIEYGPIKAAFVALCVVLGYVVGSSLDRGEG